MATGGGSNGSGASHAPGVCAGEMFDERPRNRSSLDEGSEPPAPALSWADVPADILGVVLCLLPCLADRGRVRSVCHQWRANARVQGLALPAPLPVLVLPGFRFSCLTSDGSSTAVRRALMLAEVGGDDAWIVGSSDDWLMAVRPSWHVNKGTGAGCFLVNAFSGEVVHLPHQSPSNYSCCLVQSSKDLHIRSFHGISQCVSWWLSSAVLSASPSSGRSKYTVAALTWSSSGEAGLALWQPGMTSWYLCRTGRIRSMHDDLAFYQGKLYMLCKYTQKIFAFELSEDEHGVSLSRAEHCAIVLPAESSGWVSCNMVVWRGKLLLINRFFSDRAHLRMEGKFRSVEVFALDLSTSPCAVTRIHNFDGDCIFVDKCGCRSFSAGLHAGVQGDLIYFLDERIIKRVSYTFVYNMRDGTVRRLLANSGATSYFDFPIWMFPSY